MQITDMLNQYNRNLANGTEISGGTEGVKQIVSSIQEMSVGNVFEGSVNRMEGGVVTLGLPDGKTIQAKLDAGVSVSVGESMFFQVRSNNGMQIAIRPFSGGDGSNPTILNALKAANLQVNGKTLTMVHTMMEQAMSIDKQSLSQMARFVMGNEGIDVSSIVQMAKLNIPITEEMAAQFENYKSDRHVILNQLETIMETLPEEMANGNISQNELLALNRQMLRVFLGSEEVPLLEKEGSLPLSQSQNHATDEAGTKDNVTLLSPKAAIEQEAEDAALRKEVPSFDETAKPDLQKQEKTPQTVREALEQETAQRPGNGNEGEATINRQGNAVKDILDSLQFQQLSKQLSKLPSLAERPAFFSQGELSPHVSVEDLLRILEGEFAAKNPADAESLSKLVSSKEYRTLIRNMIEEQWTMKPEELKAEHRVRELYERLDRQLAQMDKIFKSFGANASALSDTAANIRDNIQFMNQMNQMYAYVQIPLKFTQQNAHSDLFVYTDRRKAREKEGELTAFLHLDLENLGSTDISIKLRQKKVETNFYLADDASYQLILNHLDLLEKRLEQKGYQASVHVMNQEEKVNFVEDILRRETPLTGGIVHRYSFDVRA